MGLGSSRLSSVLTITVGLGLGLPSVAHVRQRFYLPSDAENTKGTESIIRWPVTSPIRVSMHQFTGTLGSGATATSIAFGSAQSLVGSAIAQWTGTFFGGLSANLTLDLSSNLPYATSSGCEGLAATDSAGNHKADGINNIVFTTKRDSTCSGTLAGASNTGVIGLTKVVFNIADGTINEADIQFDDDEFLFKTSAPNDLTASPKQIYLRDVVTHEFGHFLGLDHSSVREAAMLFAVSDGLSTVKSDDQSGMLALYPAVSMGATSSSLKGSLTRADGTPVFGASIFVLDARTLRVKGADLSDANGAFQFCALPAGPQIVYSDSYRPFGTNIHSYYSGDGRGDDIKSSYGCLNPPCEFMARTLRPAWFGSAAAGGGWAPTVLSAPVGTTSGFLNLTASDEDASLPALSGNAASIDLDAPRVALLGTDDIPLAGAAISTVHQWSFVAPSSGSVQIRSAAFRIYSRLQLSLRLLDSANTDVTATACPASAWNGTPPPDIDNVQKTASAAWAIDPWMECTVAAGQTYKVQVSGVGVACDAMPGNSSHCVANGSESASLARPVYLLSVYDATLAGSVAGGTAAYSDSSKAATTYTGLPACEAFSATVTANTSSTGSGGGCCGTIRRVSGEGPLDGPRSLLLTLLLNPVMWVGLAYLGRRLTRLRISPDHTH